MNNNSKLKNAMTLKEFGDKFINEDIEQLVNTNPYLAFFVLSAAIEFITRCRECSENFHYDDYTKRKYISTIDNLDAFKAYRKFKKKHGKGYINLMYSALRCGLLHSGMPNSGIILSSERNELDRNVVGCKDLYADVKTAWQEIQNDRNINNYINSQKAIVIDNKLL